MTPFGIVMRNIRMRRGLKLIDLAEKIAVSPAFVSAVEWGRRSIPDDYIDRVAVALCLGRKDVDDLRIAADRTRGEISVAHLSDDQYKAVSDLVRSFER